MKKSIFFILLLLLLLMNLPVLQAETSVQVEKDLYNLEVRTVDEFSTLLPMSGEWFRSLETVKTTGRIQQVQSIELQYDYAAETPDWIGKFKEDAPVALVCVDGFCEELAGLSPEEAETALILFVNGELLGNGEGCLQNGIGWQTAVTGEGCVVFPVVLTPESRTEDCEVRLTLLKDGQKITECARFKVKLTNTSEKRPKKKLRILEASSDQAAVRLVKDRLYIDCPIGTVGEVAVTLRFAAEDGEELPGILWAQPPKAGLSLEKETRTEKNCVTYTALPGMAQETEFILEGENAIYSSGKWIVTLRENVRGKEPKGVYFAQEKTTLRVGQTDRPMILALDTGLPLQEDVFTRVEYLLCQDSAPVLDVDAQGVLAVRPGVGYLSARVTVNGKVFETGKRQVTVSEEPGIFRVSCRKLNVRSGAGKTFSCLGSLGRGAQVSVAEMVEGWAHLTDGRWVCAQYLEAV